MRVDLEGVILVVQEPSVWTSGEYRNRVEAGNVERLAEALFNGFEMRRIQIGERGLSLAVRDRLWAGMTLAAHGCELYHCARRGAALFTARFDYGQLTPYSSCSDSY